jgi:hypothetical protein
VSVFISRLRFFALVFRSGVRHKTLSNLSNEACVTGQVQSLLHPGARAQLVATRTRRRFKTIQFSPNLLRACVARAKALSSLRVLQLTKGTAGCVYGRHQIRKSYNLTEIEALRPLPSGAKSGFDRAHERRSPPVTVTVTVTVITIPSTRDLTIRR